MKKMLVVMSTPITNTLARVLVTCNVCHGQGLINLDKDPKECPSCKGKGQK